MINWLCPKPSAPSGGVLFVHRLAELLDRNIVGMSRVTQVPESFDVWWGASPIDKKIYSNRMMNESYPTDITIIPEGMWHNEKGNWPNPIMFCQNWLWLDKRIPLKGVKIITVSRHLSNYLQREYQGANVVGIIHPYVGKVFDYNPSIPKTKNRVIVVSRRNNLGEMIRPMLSQAGYDIDFIDKPISQAEIAEHFSKAEYYVHLVSPEGWPQICLEAMRAGTLVVGTTGGSGNEFMFHEQTAMVAQDSVYGQVSDQEMLNRIVVLLGRLRDNEQLKAEMRSKAAEWSHRYTEEATTKELLEMVKRL